MKKCTLINLLFAIVVSLQFVHAKDFTLISPRGEMIVKVEVGERILWSVYHNDQCVLAPSVIDLEIQSQKPVFSKLKSAQQKKGNTHLFPLFYKKKEINNKYDELLLTFSSNWKLHIRAYDEGVAYRMIVGNTDVIVNNEVAEFNFDRDYDCLVPYVCDLRDKDPYCSAFESLYDEVKISGFKKDSLSLVPMMIKAAGNKKVVVCETGLKNYPGMYLTRNDKQQYGFKADFANYPLEFKIAGFNSLNEMPVKRADYIAKLSSHQQLPWRLLLVSEKDEDLLNADLVYELGGKCEIEDVSWIKPGKASWDWWNNWNVSGVDFKAGCNTNTYRYILDFASKNGLEYIVVDEGWSKNAKDMSELNPDFDLTDIVKYAQAKNVGIILWASYLGINENLDFYLEHYASLGVKGFKIDFFDRDDQRMVNTCYEIAEKAARNKLLIDFHGIFKPSGLNVCFPNVLSFEGVRGMENCKWHQYDMPKYDVTMPFLRMMAGPVDYTPGAMTNASKATFRPIEQQPMSMGTRVHQLASYIVFESPLQMLCDAPTAYLKNEECTDFLVSIPTVFDEIVPLKSEIGEYVSLARRKGDDWFIGALTNWSDRSLVIDFSFLPAGEYAAEVFIDGVNADKNGTDFRRMEKLVNAQSKESFYLASGGGLAMKLVLRGK